MTKAALIAVGVNAMSVLALAAGQYHSKDDNASAEGNEAGAMLHHLYVEPTVRSNCSSDLLSVLPQNSQLPLHNFVFCARDGFVLSGLCLLT